MLHVFCYKVYGVENEDKGLFMYISCRAFACKRAISLRARVLLFRLVERYGLVGLGEVGVGGVQRLAKSTGFSKSALSRALSILVDQGVLIERREPTKGRPRTIYRFAHALKEVVLSPSRRDFHAPWLVRLLGSDDPVFSDLSISERALLAILWGFLPRPGLCVLDGWSVSRLARLASVDPSTFYEIVRRLEQKKMLVVSGAAFASGGAKDKTKTYFLLGPAVLSCWPRSYTWQVDLTGVLGWFAGREDQFSARELMQLVNSPVLKVNEIEGGVRAELLELLNDAAGRDYVFNQCCAAISHAFSGGGSGSFNENVLYPRVQSALLRLLRMQVVGNGLYHRAIEDMDFSRLDAKSRVLSVFAEQVSFILVREFKNLLSFAPRYWELGQGNRLMVCYLVGVEEACKMRIDFVTDDSDAGDKFGAGLQVRYQKGLLDLPDQLL